MENYFSSCKQANIYDKPSSRGIVGFLFAKHFLFSMLHFLPNRLLLWVFFCVFAVQIQAQINPINPSFPLDPQNLNVCTDTSDLTVQLIVFNNNADNARVRLTFPLGVDYEAGSINIDPAFTNNGLSLVEDDLSNLNSPVFRVEPSDLALGDSLRFSIARYARCEHIGFMGSVIDEVRITQDAAAEVVQGSPAYNILSGLLTPIYTPTGRDTLINVSGFPSQLICRSFNLTQGDLGIISKPIIHRVELGADVMDYELRFMGAALPVDSIVGSSWYYTIDMSQAPFLGNVGDGDALLENGESLIFRECFSVEGCSQSDNTISHSSSWGCLDELCQQSTPYTGSVAVNGIIPTSSIARTMVNLTDCHNGEDRGHIQWTLTNQSANDAVYQIDMRLREITFLFGSLIPDESTVTIGGGAPTFWSDFPASDVRITQTAAACGPRVRVYNIQSVVIPAGETAVIDAYYISCCPDACNVGQWIPDLWDFRAWAQNPCAGTYDFVGINRYFPGGGNKDAQNPAPSGDASLTAGQMGTFCMEYPFYNLLGRGQIAGDGVIDFTIGLPTGMVFSGPIDLTLGAPGNTFTASPSSTSMNTSMDTVTLRYPVNQFRQSGIARQFVICFQGSLDCNNPSFMGGTQNINFSWSNTPNTTCDPLCEVPMRCDDVYSVLVTCPACITGGGVIREMSAARTNVQAEDPSNTRRYDATAGPADPNDIRTDRMSPGDTLCVPIGMAIIDGTENAVNPWLFGRLEQNATWGQAFNTLAASGLIRLGGVTYPFSGLLPTETNVGTEARTYHYDVSPSNLNTLNPAIPAAASLLSTDSIFVNTCYRFRTDDSRWLNQSASFSLPSTFIGSEDNFIDGRLFLSTNNTDFFDCGPAAAKVTLLSIASLHTSTGSTANPANAFSATCGEINPFSWYFFNYRGRLFADRDFDYYPNEFRPMMKLDTFYIPKKEGFELKRVRHISYTRTPGQNNGVLQDVASIPFTDLGTEYRIIYADLWEDQGGPLNLYEDNVWYRVLPHYGHNCALKTAAEDPSLVNHPGRWHLSNPSIDEVEVNGAQQLSRVFNPIGNFSYIQAPFVVDATKVENDFSLIVTNQDNALISNTWLEIVPNPNIDVTNVSIGGVDMVFNPAGFWELGTHAASATKTIVISARLNSCEPSELEVVYGWNCSGYPDMFDITPCSFDTIPYLVQPVNAQISIVLTNQPSGENDLCDPFTIDMDYASVFQADLINPAVEIVAFDGLELNTIMGTYPANSGNTEALPFTVLPNGNWLIDLTQHSFVPHDSLPGVITNSDPSARLFQLSFGFASSCDFTPGQRMQFIARGDSPCGDPAINSGNNFFSSPILIQGANPYQLGFDVIIDQNELPINGCGGGSATLNIEALVLGGTTTDADTIVVDLPAGILYENNSLVCTTAPACPSFASYDTNPDGSSVLKLKLTEGLVNFAEINFSFGIQTTLVEACSDSLPYRIRNTLTVDNLSCMGSACDDPINSILGEYNGGFDVKKTLPLLSDTTVCLLVANTYQIGGMVEIGGFNLDAGQELIIRAYCPSDPSTSIGSFTIAGPLSVGEIRPIDISTTAICAGENEVLLRFEEANNCICEDVEALVPVVVQPLAQMAEEATICSTSSLELASLNASISPLGVGGLWESSGTGTFNDGAGEFGVATTYTPSQADIDAGQIILRLIPDTPATYCPAVNDQANIFILNVDCGSFPWNGN